MKRLAAIALPLLAVLALSHDARPSSADFVASSDHSPTTFTAAAVFNTVAVSLADPGTNLRGTVALTATASSEEPLADVKFQRAPAGTTTWTDICTDATAPYTCNWPAADGLYDLRAVAADTAGYSRTSTVSNRRADNTAPTVSVVNPGGATGNATITANATDAGSGVKEVTLQYKAAASSTWTTLCTDASSPYTCAWDTNALPEGSYNLRAGSVDNAGNSATSAAVTVSVDHTPPTIAPTDDSPRSGNATMNVTAGDTGGGGIRYVRVEVFFGGAWYVVCEDTSAPYSCSVDSRLAADGVYQVRSSVTDMAGNTTYAPTVSITVDNTAPSSATMTAPTSALSGTVPLAGGGVDATSGLARLRFEYRTAGSAGAWSTACEDTVAPLDGCVWDTTGLADGNYELHVVAVDRVGLSRTSATVTARISNLAPHAKDVQATSGGAVGQLSSGDQLTFAYSRPIKTTSIDPTWSAGSLNLTVRVVDNGASDSLDFYDVTNTNRLNFGGVALGGDHVTANGTSFAAVATRSGNQILVVLGAPAGTAPATLAGAATMLWTPSTAATDESDVAVAPTAATESGGADLDF